MPVFISDGRGGCLDNPAVSGPQPLEAETAHLELPAIEWNGPASARLYSGVRAVASRAVDIVGSVAGLILLAPVLGLTALVVKMTSDGPIFYTQERVGLAGRSYRIIKFRTMRVDAEAAGAQWATCGDTRITPLGRFLRLTRLDELPQLLNVLQGSMSIVGPRPERPEFVEHLRQVIPNFDDRLLVRPGITGWAQVNYPYGASIEDARQKLAYDLHYLKHRSLRMDALIMLRTVSVVCCGTGAR